MEYLDRNIIIVALASGVALGAGVSVAMESPVGIVFGVVVAAGLLLTNYMQNRRKAQS